MAIKNNPFGFERPEHSPGFLLWQVTISWQRLIKAALAPYNISHSQFVILALLMWLKKSDKNAAQTTISKLSKLDKMTISKSLKKLAIEGYVTRSDMKEDTRSKYALLTPKGERLICQLVPIIEQIDEDFFKILSDNKRAELLSIFQTLR